MVKSILVVAATCSILTACGGGSGGPASVTAPVEPLVPSEITDTYFNNATQLDTSSYTNSATGDFNGDGLEDLVVTFAGSDPGDDQVQPWLGVPIKIYLQSAAGELEDKTSTMLATVPAIALARHIEVADFNGDGADDIYFGNHGLEIGVATGATWYEKDVLLLSNPYGTFNNDAMDTNMPEINVSGVGLTRNWYTHGIDSADIDNDGDIDLVINTAWAGATVFENNSMGSFTVKTSMPQAEMWVQFVKADSDTSPDLFIGNGDSVSTIELNDGEGNFTAGTIAMPVSQLDGKIEEAHVADVNGDGREDLIIGNTSAGFDNRVVQVLINDYDTTGQFVDETATRLPSPVVMAHNYNPSFIVRDINNDGFKDMIVAKNDNTGNTDVGVYLNVNQVFTRVATLGDLSQYITIIDLKGDGMVDVVNSNNGTYVYTARVALPQ